MFTLRTYIRDIQEVCEGRPAVAARLATAIRALPYEFLVYKSNMPLYVDRVLAQLDTAAATTASGKPSTYDSLVL